MLCRSHRFSGASRGEDDSSPLLQIVEKILEIRQFMATNRCSS